MRKAAGGLKRGSRKKQQDDHAAASGRAPPSGGSTHQESLSSSATSSSNGEQTHHHSSHSQSQRRKPTNEEAVLTSKNYRLAKELSELRVRHRDETKNVTRLTMENMNLASRCREAISHVAMLKKELAMHQKRASEALAMQRQQNQQRSTTASTTNASAAESQVLSELSDLARPSANNAPLSTNVAVEMDRMDRIMASHAPPPPPPATTEMTSPGGSGAVVATENGGDQQGSSPRQHLTLAAASTEEYGDDDDGSPTSSRSSHSSSSTPPTESTNNESASPDETDGYNKSSPPPSLFPHTASPKPKHRLNYNDDYPGDVAPHKASHESSLPAVQDEEDESSELSGHSTVSSHAREVANMKLSSIDAFEASFDTAFPTSFASTGVGGEQQQGGEQQKPSEIYNPFFSSPQNRGLVGSNSPLTRDEGGGAPGEAIAGSPDRKGRKWGSSVRDRSPAVKGSPTSSSRGSSTAGDDTSKSISTPKKTPSASSNQPPPNENGAESEVHSSPARDEDSTPTMPDPSSSPKIVSRASTYGEQYRTPPHFGQKVQETEKPAEEPRRPEKTVSASARARYEKALQPRGYHSRIKDPNSSMQVETTLDTSVEARNSPGTVLRRLQQRRAKVDRFQPTVDASSNPIPGIDSRRASRALRHPSVPTVELESPFDEGTNGKKVERKGSGRIITDQNGAYIKSVPAQSDSENNYRRSQTNPAAKKLSPDSMNAEFRALDAMVSGSFTKPGGDSPTGSELSHNSGSSSTSSSRYAALMQRKRSVKQPVSYAEPPLNTKVRQGDVFFHKREGDPAAVSPTDSSSPDRVNGSPSRSSRGSSKTRAGGASSEEVLKDLKAGPATVRS